MLPTDRYQAIDNFWNSFGVEAYDENSVPDLEELSFPYITYNVGTGSLDYPVSMSGNIWDRGTSWETVSKKIDVISTAIGSGGIVLPFSGGSVWIRRGSPFAQRLSDEDDMIRRAYINIDVEFISEN